MSDRDDIDALEGRLKDAWHEGGAATLPSDWRAGVMDSVRAAGPAASAPYPVHLVVRNGVLLATSAAAIVAAVVIGGGQNPSSALYRLVWEDPRALIDLILVF